MNQQVQIIVTMPIKDNLLKLFIQKSAESAGIEGHAHAPNNNTIKIIALGTSQAIDDFIDLIYAGYGQSIPEAVAVEPYEPKKDFRGLFRIL